MPHYKPDHLTKGVVRDTGKQLPFREQEFVDRVVGLKRKAVQMGTGFWEWPLWRAYPTWDLFHKMLADEREQAAKEGREAHPATRLRPIDSRVQKQLDEYGDFQSTYTEAHRRSYLKLKARKLAGTATDNPLKLPE